MDGYCSYQYNPSEQYRRGRPGAGVETVCGAQTYPANDEPELMPVRLGDGTVDYRQTGRYLPRSQRDPYCPAHGGSKEPPPPPVTPADLEAAYTAYLELSQRFAGQPGAAITGTVVPPAELEQAPAADQFAAAADKSRTQLAEAVAASADGLAAVASPGPPAAAAADPAPPGAAAAPDLAAARQRIVDLAAQIGSEG